MRQPVNEHLWFCIHETLVLAVTPFRLSAVFLLAQQVISLNIAITILKIWEEQNPYFSQQSSKTLK